MRTIEQEVAADGAAIETLLDAAFGPGRRVRTAYRFRDGIPAIAELGFVLREHGALVGSVRFWPVCLESDSGTQDALLLGPLAVDPGRRGTGIGIALLKRGLAAASEHTDAPVFLIGDAPYYARAGFRPVLPAVCEMPGPVDPARVLIWTADPDHRPPHRFRLLPVRLSALAR